VNSAVERHFGTLPRAACDPAHQHRRAGRLVRTLWMRSDIERVVAILVAQHEVQF